MNIINKYNRVFQGLAEEFYKKYFIEEGEEMYFDAKNDLRTIGSYNHEPGIVMMGDYYFDIGDIRTAIKEDIPKEVVFDWYDYQLEKTGNNEPVGINFINYYKKYEEISGKRFN